MAEVTSGLYKVTLETKVQGVTCYNVFWYQDNVDRDDVQDDVADAFDDDIVPALADIQSSTLTYELITADNVTGNGAPFTMVPTTTVGTRTGEKMPSFNAMGFKYVRTTKDTRNGSKRFAGLMEEDTEGNKYTTAFQTLLDAAAVDLKTNISVTGIIARPVIVKTRKLESDPWVINEVANVIADTVPTSQVSRKP